MTEPVFLPIVSSRFVPPLGLDPDVEAWRQGVISANGQITVTQRNATNTFVLGLKTDGLWAKIRLLWHCLGDFAASRICLKHPGGINSLVYNDFVPTSLDNQGLLGRFEYVDLKFNPFIRIPNQNSVSLGVHASGGGALGVGGEDPSNGSILALATNTADGVPLGAPSGVTLARICNASSQVSGFPQSSKMIMASRLAVDDIKIYEFGTQLSSGTGNGGPLPNVDLTTHCLRSGVNILPASNLQRISMVFVGDGLTATEVANFRTRYSTFCSAVSRSTFGV